MSVNQNERRGDDDYEARNDAATDVTGSVNDDSYATSRNETIPVQKDSDAVEDPIQAPDSNSDAQLERDENDAIDQSNVMGQRTRGAKPGGSYSEGPDEDDLPAEVVSGDVGRSAGA
ncbi:MAG: hypothetical protein MMC23_000131 [Stictis urceolatum]|nr:hypothetical protein [Stictis urceolata]